MHAHPDPRHILAATLGALILTVMTFMLASGLGSLDLSAGSGGSDAAPAAVSEAAAPERSGPPAWLDDPLASPLDRLRWAPSPLTPTPGR